MTSLIERIEAATGPDRELDWEIHLRDGLEGVGAYGQHPCYTDSVDAALTLVPEGLFPTANFSFKQVWLRDANGMDATPHAGWAKAKSIPLAICAAVLRARGVA